MKTVFDYLNNLDIDGFTTIGNEITHDNGKWFIRHDIWTRHLVHITHISRIIRMLTNSDIVYIFDYFGKPHPYKYAKSGFYVLQD